MTLIGKFYNWQEAGTGNLHYNDGPSPCLVTLRDYMGKRWGGQNLGLFGVRPIRGGVDLSSHAFGAAWDWRYQAADGSYGPGPGRQVVLNEVFPFLINNSRELGVDSIHDYLGGQIWHGDRNAWRPQQASIYGMGQGWAGYLHIECHYDNWPDGRNVETKLELVDTPMFDPAHGLWGMYPYEPKPTIRMGAKGDLVKYLQGVMRVKLGYAIVVDGYWGPITNNFVVWFQTAEDLVVDGICGPKTWAHIDAYAAA